MKSPSLRVLALALVPAAAFQALPSARPATVPAVQDADQIAYDDFVTRFRQYLKIGDKAEMAKLVGLSPEVAVRYADTLCQQIAREGSEELELQVAALRIAWQTSMKTKFVDHMYEYFSLLDVRAKAERERLAEVYDKALSSYLEARKGTDDGAALDQAAVEFEGLAGGFAHVGDHLNVGRCWTIVGACHDEDLRHGDADLRKAHAALTKALAAFDEIELVGPVYSSVKDRRAVLEANGFTGPEPGPGSGPGTPTAGQPALASTAIALTAPMSFEAVEEVEAFQRPNYFADDLYQIWLQLGMQGKGTSAAFSSITKGGPKVERVGAAQFVVRDAAEKPREPITVTGNLTLVEATLDDGGTKRPWAFLVRPGIQDDTYQGRKANMAPSDQYLSLFYFNAASVVGDVNGVRVRVLDDNMDGVYGSPPLTWQYIGLAKDFAQPDVDGIVLGESTRALPWSEFQRVGEAWYKLEVLQGGLTLRATPVELQTGTLRLDFKGEYPAWVMVRGKGVLENSYFDVCVTGKKGVELPVGEYQLFSGLVRKGKKQQAMKCLILPGRSMATWTVSAGAESVMKLGGPFSFEFDVDKGADKVVVPGAGVKVKGVSGEMYDRFWNCVPEPEVSLRKAGSRKGGKAEEMPKVLGDLDELKEDGTRKFSFFDVWRPMSLELELKKSGEQVEVQLSEKKNKLFGSIESDWK